MDVVVERKMRCRAQGFAVAPADENAPGAEVVQVATSDPVVRAPGEADPGAAGIADRAACNQVPLATLDSYGGTEPALHCEPGQGNIGSAPKRHNRRIQVCQHDRRLRQVRRGPEI